MLLVMTGLEFTPRTSKRVNISIPSYGSGHVTRNNASKPLYEVPCSWISMRLVELCGRWEKVPTERGYLREEEMEVRIQPRQDPIPLLFEMVDAFKRKAIPNKMAFLEGYPVLLVTALTQTHHQYRYQNVYG